MKPYYNPRNRNIPIDRNRQSWSTVFDERVAREREPVSEVGFNCRQGSRQ